MFQDYLKSFYICKAKHILYAQQQKSIKYNVYIKAVCEFQMRHFFHITFSIHLKNICIILNFKSEL